jgi:hypothetical protein
MSVSFQRTKDYDDNFSPSGYLYTVDAQGNTTYAHPRYSGTKGQPAFLVERVTKRPPSRRHP